MTKCFIISFTPLNSLLCYRYDFNSIDVLWLTMCTIFRWVFISVSRYIQSSFFNCTIMTMSWEISKPDWVIIHPVRFGGSLSLLLTLKMDNNCHCQGFLFPILLNFSRWTVFFAIPIRLILCFLEVMGIKLKTKTLLIFSTNYFTTLRLLELREAAAKVKIFIEVECADKRNEKIQIEGQSLILQLRWTTTTWERS